MGLQPDVAAPGDSGLTSVIIVAADSGDGLAECVARSLGSAASVEVIVADNASRDGSVARVAQLYAQNEQVRILHNDKNLGFGTACNRAAAQACGDALLFLNPDCLIETDTIARLRAVATGDARIGLIGALQLDAQGRVDTASRRRDPLLRRALSSFSGLARLASRWPALAGVAMPPLPADGVAARNGASEPVEAVDAVSGALMFLPHAAFARMRGFDEDYFLHCEDLDLCRRMRDAGLRVVCATALHVRHAKGGSSRRRPLFVAWHKHSGMWRWFSKFDPAARNPLLRALVWCGTWLHFALLIPLYLLRALKARFASVA
ncbi:glycosyltransferase family 2 protein [Rudaea sp.]|uniref:glycosyltransferase family 2 protein n=1 Tax=Rudaea sp. TaxID=2136325 RepID=UPI002F9350B8